MFLAATHPPLRQQLHRCQVLSGNALKVIAVGSMVVDHFSKIILLWMLGQPWLSDAMTAGIQEVMLSWLYPIGTIAFPLFAFLLSEGFQHTQHRKRYFALMAGFALLSELPFDLAFFSWQTASSFTRVLIRK